VVMVRAQRLAVQHVECLVGERFLHHIPFSAFFQC
jgi:hypothetical protein